MFLAGEKSSGPTPKQAGAEKARAGLECPPAHRNFRAGLLCRLRTSAAPAVPQRQLLFPLRLSSPQLGAGVDEESYEGHFAMEIMVATGKSLLGTGFTDSIRSI